MAPRATASITTLGVAGGGPIVWKNVLGGSWYFFGNYEGFRWPQHHHIYRIVPSDLMRQGILQYKDQPVSSCNINMTDHGAVPAGPCDPRGWDQSQPCRPCGSLSRNDFRSIVRGDGSSEMFEHSGISGHLVATVE